MDLVTATLFIDYYTSVELCIFGKQYVIDRDLFSCL